MSQFASESLLWIKSELDATMAEARHVLEATVEQGADMKQMSTCADHLHQVQGTLRMVEVYGGALLAEEMELVAQAMAEGRERDRVQASEILMRAMVQLPDYLDRVMSGHRDLPLVLLPLLNDLRTVRGEGTLSEDTLVSHDMEQVWSELPSRSENPSGEDAPAAAKAVRARFQGALVKFFKGDMTQDGAMRDATSQIEHAATHAETFRLWWIVGAVLEGLAIDDIEATVTLKQQIGQVDRQIKRLIDDGEDALAASWPRELVSNLVFSLTQSTSEGTRAAQVRAALGIEGALPDADEIEAEREGLAGPNLSLMRTVSAAIKEDLGRIKDALDIFVRTGKSAAEDLEPLTEQLKKVADTLGVLGVGGLREKVEEEHRRLLRMTSGDLAADEGPLMEMAAALLEVETALDEQVASQVTGPGAEGGLHSESDFSLVSTAVLRECIINLARVKESIVEYVTNSSDKGVLDPLPALIHQIQAGLSLLEMERPVGLLDSVARYIRRRIQGGAQVPRQKELDRMADAIVSVEYYMETVQQRRGDPQYMLDNAEVCVAALGFPVGAGDAAEEPDAEAAGTEELEQVAAVAQGPAVDLDAIRKDGESTIVAPVIGFTDQKQPGDEEATMVAPEPTEEYARPGDLALDDEEDEAPPTPKLISIDDVDPELLEIFIEEAKEVIETIQEYLPRWQNDAADHDALVTLRRSFHTLKGSGRMVGATQIGEFAWTFENLLNRIIDRTLERAPAIIDLAARAMAALPGMVEQLESGTPAEIDTEALRIEAENHARVASGEAPLPPAAPAAPEPEPEPEPEPAEEPTPELDPVLLEIFTKETYTHLEDLEHYLEKARELEPPWEVTDEFYKAIHTLNGSSNMAGVAAVNRITAPVDRYARKLRDLDEGFDEAALGVVEQLTRSVRAVVESINRGEALPDQSSLLAAIEHLSSGEPLHPHGPDLEALSGALPIPTAGAQIEEAVTDEEITIEGAGDLEQPEPEPIEVSTAGETVEEATTDEEITIEGAGDLEEPEPEPLAIPTDGEAVEEAATDEEITIEGPGDLDLDIDGTEPAAVEAAPSPAADEDFGAATIALEDVDPELVEIFTEEAQEILDGADRTVTKIGSSGVREEYINELQRALHTLKGGARMAALTPMGDLSHEMETLMIEVAEGRVPADDDLLALVRRSVDQLHRMLEQVQNGQPVATAVALIAEVRQVHGVGVDAGEFAAPVESVRSIADTQPAAGIIRATTDDDAVARVEAGEAAERPMEGRRDVVRVRAEVLESLLNQAGEISIFRSRLEQQVTNIEFNLGELSQTVNRLRDQLRALERETEAQILATWQDEIARQDGFDPLEMDQYSTIQQLSRALAESTNDLVSIQGTLNELTSEAESLLIQQSRTTTDLQDALMRTRMVPFQLYAQRLARIVRQTAQEEGKRTELSVIGGEGELDRQVLERMMPPMEHMLRNAVVHGIEPPETRQAKGKQPQGQVSIRLHREGAEMVIQVFDDGRGLDIRRIRSKAESMGLAIEGAEVSDGDIAQFIFEPGFTTAEKVTQTAGRGVGMDVVHNEVKQLGGALAIETQEDQGATFVIRLPFTLAITQALLVSVGEDNFAIPLPTIEGIARVSRKQVERYLDGSEEKVIYGGEEYLIQHLGALLKAPVHMEEGEDTIPVIMVRAGEHNTALVTDAMRGSREIVVKSVGPQISSIRGVSGATILGDGRIVLILDVGALARAGTIVRAVVRAADVGEKIVDERRYVLVVDDSITVRRVTQRLLERHGMRVRTAKDGIDALSVLQDDIPDVMLLDIEMPRMDGYELAGHMRSDSRFKKVPIVMITSRVGEKHRNRAMELGVDDYLGKPYQESQLLETIEKVLV
jgi:chemosensory pili system protein ChpA (sensor histidine kinase/response regulator)